MVNVNVTPLPLNPVIKVWNSSIISRFGVNQTSWIFIQLFTHKIFHLLPTFSFFSSTPPPHVPLPYLKRNKILDPHSFYLCKTFNLTEFIVKNIKKLNHQVAKKLEFVANVQLFVSFPQILLSPLHVSQPIFFSPPHLLLRKECNYTPALTKT